MGFYTTSLADSKTHMTTGICALCGLKRELCESHALPHSQFNYVLRKSAGKAIQITDGKTTPVQYSSDTWGTDMLCVACEENLNRKYDSYGLGVFRGYLATVHRNAAGICLLNIDRQRLRMFFLSILWRISISSHVSYSNVDLPYEYEDSLREALRQSRHIPDSRFTVRVHRLHNSTDTQGLTAEDLRNFIMAPFGRQYEHSVCVCYPFLGFFIETFLPRLPRKYKNLSGILSGTSKVFVAPHLEVLAVPEIKNLIVQGVRKHDAGLSKVG
jgi:hypothetical protein